VLRVAPVPSFLIVTVAFGTAAPLGSVTVPLMSPEVSDCPNDAAGMSSKQIMARVTTRVNGTTYDLIGEFSWKYELRTGSRNRILGPVPAQTSDTRTVTDIVNN